MFIFTVGKAIGISERFFKKEEFDVGGRKVFLCYEKSNSISADSGPAFGGQNTPNTIQELKG